MVQAACEEVVRIEAASYIYRVQHRTMEGDCQYDHGPRLVEIPALEVDKYPVTNLRFQRFLTESGYKPADDTNFLKHWRHGAYPDGQENHPVVWVSQSDAKAFATWVGGRLPYDYEWQWIACGTQKTKWPWGNQFDARKCNGEEGGCMMPVTAFPEGAGEFGCLDLCGNAWEWVEDVVDDGMHYFTFLRGGSYYKAPHMWHAEGGPQPTDFHLKFPLLNEGLNRNETVGFRCVKEVGGA